MTRPTTTNQERWEACTTRLGCSAFYRYNQRVPAEVFRYLTAVANGTDSAEAIQTVYGNAVDLRNGIGGYIGQGLNHLIAKIEIDRTKKEVAAEGLRHST
jgi:hypothetical protein